MVCGLFPDLFTRSAPEKPSGAPDCSVHSQFACHPSMMCLITRLLVDANGFPGPNGSSYNPWITSRCGRSALEITRAGLASFVFRYEVASRYLENVYDAPKVSPFAIRLLT